MSMLCRRRIRVIQNDPVQSAAALFCVSIKCYVILERNPIFSRKEVVAVMNLSHSHAFQTPGEQ